MDSFCPKQTFTPPLHQSSIACCMRCKRCYLYRYLWGLRAKRAKSSSAATTGTLLHKLMQFGPSRDAEAQRWYVGKLTEIASTISQSGDPLGTEQSKLDAMRSGWCKAKMMAQHFWSKYPLPSHIKEVGSELKHSVELPIHDSTGHPIILEGTIDKLLLDEGTGQYLNRDFKTSSRDVAFTTTGYTYSLQCRIYRLLAEHYVWFKIKQGKYSSSDIAVPGFILDVLQVPTIKLCSTDRDFTTSTNAKGELVRKYHGEPVWDNYVARCAQWYTDNEKTTTSSFFIRYSEPMLSPELLASLTVCSTYTHTPPLADNFSRDVTRSYCTEYERVCEYYDLCSSSPENWESIIAAHYTQADPFPAESTETENVTETIVE